MTNNYSAADAAILMKISYLPQIYEMTLHKSGEHDLAYDKMVDHAGELGVAPNNIQLIRSGNTTSVLLYSPEENSLTFAFEPTLSKGTVFNNADYFDNALKMEKSHSIGGHVHYGLYSDLMNEVTSEPSNLTLIEAISEVIAEYADQSDTPLKVNATGFSKGGAQASIAVAEMTHNGLFDYPNIQLNNVYAFAPVAYGTEEFIAIFDQKAEEIGANVWTVEYSGDPFLTIFSPDGAHHFIQGDYNQFGNRAYIREDEQGIINVLTNPSAEELESLREQDATEERVHVAENYIQMTESYKTQFGAPSDPTHDRLRDIEIGTPLVNMGNTASQEHSGITVNQVKLNTDLNI